MCEALRDLFKDELEERERLGENNKLLELIRKKLAKSKSTEQIADEL